MSRSYGPRTLLSRRGFLGGVGGAGVSGLFGA
ncbi:MAG: hypothetical protein JWN43_3024, partial [Gammaproteobacteria bacterium]|nr:hypothetical protein [Gammaproteobacteria bacterium]